MAEENTSKANDSLGLMAGDVSQEFYKIAAMANATRAIIMEHNRAQKDSELVSAWLNLQVIIEKANHLGDHFIDLD